MKLKRLLSVLDVHECTADPELDIRDISFDSRTTQPGDLFAAVCGYESDGHRFIGAAVARGAAVVLCQKKPEVDIPYILVADSRLALSRICCEFFDNPSRELTMIGVTGTNGKTTVTTLIKHMLEQCLHTKVGLIGTNANIIGDEVLHTEHTTPDAYELQKLLRRMVDAGCTHAVMEVSSHSLVLHRVEGIRFQVGIFTNLTQDHLDFHKTMENYRQAKAILFTVSDRGVINLDDAAADKMLAAGKCPCLTYSCGNEKAGLCATNLQLHADGVEFDARYNGETAHVRLPIPGHFSVENALNALGMVLSLGMPLADAAKSMATATGVKGRVEVVPTDTDYTVLIDYAHSPDGVENVLKAVRGFAKGRVVALFGCGGRDRTKRPKMGRIAADLADFCIVTSDNPRTEEPKAIIDDILEGMKDSKTPMQVIVDRPAAIHWALEHAQKDDIIVLMGKGHETYQEVNHVKHHMDEREIVAEYFKN